MLDCSRNAVFTVEKVKSVIRTLAKMGMNVLMLYTEDTYEVPGEPYFGSYRGHYTKAEIQEMDAYASMFGIELVPCIQTLAHLHNALKWPGKNEIKDSTDVLIVGKEETYVFIEKISSFDTHTATYIRVYSKSVTYIYTSQPGYKAHIKPHKRGIFQQRIIPGGFEIKTFILKNQIGQIIA